MKQFDDYDWKAVTSDRRIAILPDMREMSEAQIDALEVFVEHGNVLLISGLTGFYGPGAKAWPLAGFPMGKITGAMLKEVHLRDPGPAVALDPAHPLPARLWLSTITPEFAQAKAFDNGEAVATERALPGAGSTVVTNGTAAPTRCVLDVPSGLTPMTLWGSSPKVEASRAAFALGSRGTSVVLWR